MAARKLTPLRAIRQKCLMCCMGSSKEVEACTCGDEPLPCPLYEFRFGKSPYHKGRGKSKDMAHARAALKNNRDKKSS